MKTIWNVIAMFVFVHVVAGVILIAWLRQSDRLNMDRLTAVRDIFETTITQQQIQGDQAKQLSDQASSRRRDLARLQSIESGPLSVASRLEVDRAAQELALASLQRYKDDIQVLRDQIEQGKRKLQSEQERINAQKKQLDDQIQRRKEQQESVDFRRTVKMFEQVKPKQAKKMFQELLARNRQDQVVTYLAAMSQRKAATVLKQFKEPAEIVQATELLERLRARGIRMQPQPDAKEGTRS